MAWTVQIADEFESEFKELDEEISDAIIAKLAPLRLEGPNLGRPLADSLYGSKHSNMKELRFAAGDGEWRVAFAFDPQRKAILLVAGDKSGVSETKFYKELIRKADSRFDAHLARLKGR